MRIPASLRGRKNVVIDTMIFIYLFEDFHGKAEVCDYIVRQTENASFSGVVTPITATEILVKPLESNRNDVADRYRSALRNIKNIRCIPITFDVGCLAGALRAKYKLPLPDMMQAACALQGSRPAIITNDKALRKVKEMDVFVLKDFM